MRVKDFEDKMNQNLDYIWFLRNHLPSTLNEGKRVDANARLLRMCVAACAIGGTVLEVTPLPPVQQAVITGVTAGGPADGSEDDGTTESPGDSGEGERDPT